MVLSSVNFLVLLLASASVRPASVAAIGEQETTLHIVKPGMYHLSARSGHGTTCQVVDIHRGPFAYGGLLGTRDCELDLLLDMGSYLVRLHSPKKATGKVELSLKEFIQDRPKPLLLKRGRSDNTKLSPGHQVSWWIKVQKNRDVEIVVAGKNAGRVELWREGKWIQSIQKKPMEYFSEPGQPRYFWRLSGKLEPADYRLVVYGVSPKKWTMGKPDESLFVSNGYESAGDNRLYEFQIPKWGFVIRKIKGGKLGVHLQLNESPLQEVTLDVRDFAATSGDGTTSSGKSHIESKSLEQECVANSGGSKSHVVSVWGPEGTMGSIRWYGYLDQGWGYPKLTDDMFVSMNDAFKFSAPEDGKYLVGVVDVPSDPDALALSCKLAPMRRSMFGITKKYDYVLVGKSRYLDRHFNYDGSHASIWFKVQEPGLYSVRVHGSQVKKCDLFLQHSKSIRKATGCNLSLAFGKGLYRMELYDGKPGIARISIKPGARAAKNLASIHKTSCWFNGIELRGKSEYGLKMNRKGRAEARGLVLRRLPLRLTRPLFLVIDPGDVIRLPIAPGDPVVVRGSGSSGLLCSTGVKPPLPASGQRCRLARSKKNSTITMGNVGELPLWVSLSRVRKEPNPQPLQIYSPKIVKLPTLEPGKIIYADFQRNQSHSALLHVPTAGVYEASTLGLLSTKCSVRTPVFANMFSNQGGGRGRNCLVAGYMNEGDYLLSATTQGRSMGRAGITIRTRKIKKGPAVAEGGEVFFKVPASQMLKQKLIVRTKHTFSLTTKAQGASLRCRLEDDRGWPMLEVPCSCRQRVTLKPGTYYWSQMPLTVDSSRSTSLLPVRDLDDEVIRGPRIHQVRFNNNYTVRLNKSGRDRFRFVLQAPMDVTINLDRNMVGRLAHEYER